MCMDPELKAVLETNLATIRKSIEAECDVYHQTGASGVSEKFRELMDEERSIKKRIEEIPHRFEIGDGAHSANNGDCYPYRVVEVSKSGKSIQVVSMGYRAVKPVDGSELQCGHQDWEVYDEVDYVKGETSTATYTLRKNGRWIREGCGLKDYWMALHPGAHYSHNWHV